jgi:beta-lactamase class A
MRDGLWMIALATSAVHPSPVGATSVQTAPDLYARIDQLRALMAGTGDYETLFAEPFRQQVPRQQWQALAAQLAAAIGPPLAIDRIDRANALEATIRLRHQRGYSHLRVALEPGSPHRIAGLFVTGTAPLDDSLAQVSADLARLPGRHAIGVYRLEDTGPLPLHESAADRPAPIGSAFKLWVLAELAAQVTAGERRWSDVVPLGPPSLPSGVTQGWPVGAPVTLHTLATLMIGESDNSATDTLMTTLGRDRVDGRAQALGAAQLPVLTTREAFFLKSPAGAEVARNWPTLTPGQRRARLASAPVARTPLDPAIFTGVPLHLDIEWFASPRAMADTLDWLRRKGGDEALAILATGAPTVAGAAWSGYKGGSEPGVHALAHLARFSDGRWYAVTATATREDASIDVPAFTNAVSRALSLLPTLR